MKAIRVTAQADGTCNIEPLALPTAYRKGVISSESYHRPASGASPKTNFTPNTSNSVSTIVMADGKFTGLASKPGALLTFVISGELTLGAGTSQTWRLEPGDVLLTDGRSSSDITVNVRNQCRLVQIGVAPDWPGPDAKLQQPGTLHPRQGNTPKLKRVYRGEDDKAYFSEFSEVFPEVLNQWSSPHRIAGFRMTCWEDGSMDWHPSVTNQFAIVHSGEMETEVGGGGGAVETFHAGDICIAEDRTGEGHIGRVRGVVHVTIMVLQTEDLW